MWVWDAHGETPKDAEQYDEYEPEVAAKRWFNDRANSDTRSCFVFDYERLHRYTVMVKQELVVKCET